MAELDAGKTWAGSPRHRDDSRRGLERSRVFLLPSSPTQPGSRRFSCFSLPSPARGRRRRSVGGVTPEKREEGEEGLVAVRLG